jgi:hypothetical protein
MRQHENPENISSQGEEVSHLGRLLSVMLAASNKEAKWEGKAGSLL